MADETSTSPQQGARAGGNREPGGFRIRLSDNEMRSARALQEAFRLRSTVAVLGFCVRTLGQMLEEGKLDELVEQQRAQAGSRDGGRPARRGGDERPGRAPAERGVRVDPFARPSRPAPAAPEQPQLSSEASGDGDVTADVTAADLDAPDLTGAEIKEAEPPAGEATPAES